MTVSRLTICTAVLGLLAATPPMTANRAGIKIE
jgi:hypothetical protein